MNKNFLASFHKRFGADYPNITELAMATYQGIQLWAEAVKKAGTIDRDEGDRGARNRHQHRRADAARSRSTRRRITASLDVHIAEVEDKKLKVLEDFAQQKPADTAAVCDLIKNPNDNQQYVIKI